MKFSESQIVAILKEGKPGYQWRRSAAVDATDCAAGNHRPLNQASMKFGTTGVMFRPTIHLGPKASGLAT